MNKTWGVIAGAVNFIIRKFKVTRSEVLGGVVITVTVLTLITLVLDLPEKAANAYRDITRAAPTININALFLNQGALTVDPVTDDASKGYSNFLWPAVYEIHNVSNQDVTINRIENILNEVDVGQHRLHLSQVKDEDEVIGLYENFESLTSETSDKEHGVTERLPYTIKAGTKLYVKVMGSYNIEDNGQLLFCKIESDCYKLLVLALGVAPETESDATLPCVLKTFKTRIEFEKYRDMISDQKAILIFPGCKLNLEPLMDKVMIDKKK